MLISALYYSIMMYNVVKSWTSKFLKWRHPRIGMFKAVGSGAVRLFSADLQQLTSVRGTQGSATALVKISGSRWLVTGSSGDLYLPLANVKSLNLRSVWGKGFMLWWPNLNRRLRLEAWGIDVAFHEETFERGVPSHDHVRKRFCLISWSGSVMFCPILFHTRL